MLTEDSMNSNFDDEEIRKVNELEHSGTYTDDEDFESEESKFDKTDYSLFEKKDFVAKAKELVYATDIKEAHESYKKMRVLLDDIIKSEREILLQEFVAAGNEPRDFRPPVDELKDEFYQEYTKFLERRKEEKNRAEEEKRKNLELKKDILEKIRVLTEKEETENSLNELKELQNEWRQIRIVPKEQMNELWDSYRVLLDKFYDNLSIYNELKDLDRQKNLEAKIELTKKAGELMDVKSVKRSHILLNKLHEDFKNIGPVPREFTEDVWKRFKDASDTIIERNKKIIEELKADRNKNFDLKTIICEKAEQISNVSYKNSSEWNDKSKEMEALFEEWKGVGPVPDSMNDQIWKRFRQAQNSFYKLRKDFFDDFNKDKEKNYKLKIAICEKAEKLSDSTDFDNTASELIKLQEEWKSIGPVPHKHNEEIWKRFRTACDSFFKRRDIHKDAVKVEEQENLKLKQALIEKLENFSNSDGEKDKNEVVELLRSVQKEWYNIGFVPRKNFKGLMNKFEQLNDSILKKFNLSVEEFKHGKLKEHYELIAQKPNSKSILKNEERKIFGKIKSLKEEITTLENNMGFFANSKNADALLKDFKSKLNKSEQQIEKLNEELKILRSAMR